MAIENTCTDHDHRTPPAGLTKNETLVWGALDGASEPLKAYEILDLLKDQGVRAPMTVYRALNGLLEKGRIHKLDGLNAFVICNHDHPHLVQTFLVCEKCSHVEELEMTTIEAGILEAMRKSSFALNSACIEIKGECAKCAA